VRAIIPSAKALRARPTDGEATRHLQFELRIKLEHPLSCVSHRAFAGITAGDVGEFPFEDARSQNIENNPVQSSRRPAWMLRKRVDTSGKSRAFFDHPVIFKRPSPRYSGRVRRDCSRKILIHT
jgi:hypothetical protein